MVIITLVNIQLHATIHNSFSIKDTSVQRLAFPALIDFICLVVQYRGVFRKKEIFKPALRFLILIIVSFLVVVYNKNLTSKHRTQLFLLFKISQSFFQNLTKLSYA